MNPNSFYCVSFGVTKTASPVTMAVRYTILPEVTFDRRTSLE